MRDVCGCAKDVFFYSLVYDNQQKSLIADHGEIRVGQRYQVEIIPDKLQSRTSVPTAFIFYCAMLRMTNMVYAVIVGPSVRHTLVLYQNG